jgi:hypothetical protein
MAGTYWTTIHGAASSRKRLRSIGYLAHITDPQVTDEVSPARVGFGFFGTRRAHDPFTMHTAVWLETALRQARERVFQLLLTLEGAHDELAGTGEAVFWCGVMSTPPARRRAAP